MPKGIDISDYSQAKLDSVARQLNERPRKTLGFQTPAQMFGHCVALTGRIRHIPRSAKQPFILDEDREPRPSDRLLSTETI